ncbi:MAG: glycoside hydrolase family 15 protein [Solirubrobacteraceae bacterium]|nr:glycoside hydrolase family 15 protein [Solirubrobacteraceae bacterium]
MASDVGPAVGDERYVPIRDYAAIGDGRTVALVSRGGSVDWLCLPDLDSPSVFGALLDSRRGGRFELAPEAPFEVERRYVDASNVLLTTFRTADGAVRVTDAMTIPGAELAPGRELVRRVEGLAGSVPMRWRLTPRLGYASWPTRVERRSGVPVVTARGDAIAVCAWSAGQPEVTADAIAGRVVVEQGRTALLALSAAHDEPLVLPARVDVERRLSETTAFWRRWAGRTQHDGPWREAVVRSALALKLLFHAPSGAIAAAATTSLPEAIGGERNWDYRYSWVRDSFFTLQALQRLSCVPESEAFLWWLLHASQLTSPELRVLYRLDGGAKVPERILRLAGYRGSAPVRVGNEAVRQRQLDVYGDLFETMWLHVGYGHRLDRETARRLARSADLVARTWELPDSGIWEVRSVPRHFTHSKVMCWAALDRAQALARDGHLPARSAGRWRAQADAARRFVDERCWSEAKQSYVRFAGGEELDASLLFTALVGFGEPPGERVRAPGERVRATVDAVRRELANGPLVHRYLGEDGLAGREGAFLACSFWLVEALARTGRVERAGELLDELVALANDVGLYAEEIDPQSGEFLGNFPQALVHLALINAAVVVSGEMAA